MAAALNLNAQPRHLIDINVLIRSDSDRARGITISIKMILYTQRLFTRLLVTLRINVVCDVGSMNGADALNFRDAVPDASIYAFEPNPANLLLMRANRALQERNIQIMPLAATNCDGEAMFFLVDADYCSQNDCRRGMSSLHKREGGDWASADVVRVKTTRLDTFLADRCAPDARLALWIDTEGKAFEVIEGMMGMAERVLLLHVEVETAACIGTDQKLYSDVKASLEQLGFAELATDLSPRGTQFNALFLRSDLVMQFRTKARLMHARLRYLVGQTLRKACPACLRRYQALIREMKAPR
jgi:FkbM family methyltransferase